MDQNDTIFGLFLAITMLAVLMVNTWNSAPVESTATTTPSIANTTSVTNTHESLTATKQGNSMSDIVNITITTNLGAIELELYADKAPLTVANFVAYAEAGFYEGTIFHRVIEGFMIQGGGFNEEFDQKPTNDPVQNEADNGLTNDNGTIAMARTSDPQSATAQFFINVADNDFLNFRSADASGYGYAVFGKVVGGDAIVEKIKSVATGSGGPMPTDVPKEAIIIESVAVTQ